MTEGVTREAEGRDAWCGSYKPFPVTLRVEGGQAILRLRRGALAGPVGPDGSLDQLRWRDRNNVEKASGRITDGRFALDYRYSVHDSFWCVYHYEGERHGGSD